MIYLVSSNDDRNFGAILQAYALQQFLLTIGYRSKFITIDKNLNYAIEYSKTISLNSIIRNVVLLFTRKKYMECFSKFDKFVVENLDVTDKKYSYKLLLECPPKADAYIVGSDQMWPPTNIKPENFLVFGDKKIKRISYAVSIGKNYIPDKHKEKFIEYLSLIDYVSIREKTSKEFLETIISKKISTNIDPTLLLDNCSWDKLIEKPKSFIDREYILIYLIYKPKWLNGELKKLKKETGLDIVLITTNPFKKAFCDEHIKYAGPKEFLWLIRNARYVISSSYHGCLFSIIYKKNFLAIVNPDNATRHRDMLNMFGLSNREVKSLSAKKFDNIEYEKVYEQIKIQRDQSKKYLLEALNNEKTC